MSSNRLEEWITESQMAAKTYAAGAARGFRNRSDKELVLHDAVQQASAEANRRGIDYFLEAPDPKGYVRHYMCKVARRYVATRVRDAVRRSEMASFEGLTTDPPSLVESPLNTVIWRERRELLKVGMEKLPANYRKVIMLRLDQYTWKEIGEKMGGVNSSTAYDCWKRACDALRTVVGRQGEDEDKEETG